MVEHLVDVDRQLLYYINVAWTNDFFDVLFPLLRNKFFWAPLYVFLLVFILLNFRKNSALIVLYALLTVLVSDQLSSTFLKPLFERSRPCNFPALKDYINLLVSCGSGLSFPSSHAANHFAVAFFFGLIGMKISRLILPIGFLWAFAVGYAQVYVGVHYPFDILSGAFVGCLIGAAMAAIYSRFAVPEI